MIFILFRSAATGFMSLPLIAPERTEPEMIVDWTQSTAIKQGAQTNHLKVIAVGSSIKYFVNDQLLGEVQDSRLPTGTIRFSGALDEGGAHVSFDNLKRNLRNRNLIESKQKEGCSFYCILSFCLFLI